MISELCDDCFSAAWCPHKNGAYVTRDGAIFFHKNNTFDFFNRPLFPIMASCSTVLFFSGFVYCQLLSTVLANSARLAQSVEHETLNLRVVGSSPTLGVHLFPSATTLFFASKGMC